MTKSVFSREYEQLRSLLIEARNQKGLTQAEVAERLKKPQSFVSKYENGERRLDVIEFLEVTEVIGADPLEIVAKLMSK